MIWGLPCFAFVCACPKNLSQKSRLSPREVQEEEGTVAFSDLDRSDADLTSRRGSMPIDYNALGASINMGNLRETSEQDHVLVRARIPVALGLARNSLD